MILIKTERLHSLRGKIAAGDFLARSQEIATEQKRFKESFNQFTELDASHEQAEDAQEQAELKSGDVPEISAAGNEALREMLASIRAMWKAEGSLGVADTGQAIENEKEALVHLKAAQKGLRYSPPVAARAKPVDLKRRYLGELDGIRSRLERLPRKQESEFDRRLRASLALVYDAARALAQLQPEQAGASQRFNQARQNLERAADDLLSLKGELALSLLEPASKLKLLGRMLGSNESPQEAFGLTVQVASELSALLGRTERAGPALSSNNLPPASRAKAATYFKLLANP
jgi:DNA repair exonuclease SbcCD ATPase subunit